MLTSHAPLEAILSDALGRGITVAEMTALDQPIELPRNTTAAFIGGALRGPLNTPVWIGNVGQFHRVFGDRCPASSLGPAVRRFFANGGAQLYVVRVANGARGALLCLPASGSALLLRAVEPGAGERVRAAVDYDGLDDAERFNLTLQRTDPVSRLVVDQEIHPDLCWQEDDERFVADVLTVSTIARVERPYPRHRPQATLRDDASRAPDFVEPVQQGSDGGELTDYDLVGSRRDFSGLFALDGIGDVDLVYLPPPARGRDVGPAALLAAEMFCRERGAMLIHDPPRNWRSVDAALAGMRDLGLASPHVIGYFPRVVARGDSSPSPAGAALAGLLCRIDRGIGPWQSVDADGIGLERSLVPQVDLDDEDTALLGRAGINVLRRGRSGPTRVCNAVTLARGSESHRPLRQLHVQRSCLSILRALDLASRWAVFRQPTTSLIARLQSSIDAFLQGLVDAGALVNSGFSLRCDPGVRPSGHLLTAGSTPGPAASRGVTIEVAFQPAGARRQLAFRLQQSAAGCRISDASRS